jgi:DNA-binding SARP family transcriptional activator
MFADASALLRKVIAQPTSEGLLSELAHAALIENLILARAPRNEIAAATEALARMQHDQRCTVGTITALSLGSHYGTDECSGGCLTDWNIDHASASRWPVAEAGRQLKLAVLRLDHGGRSATDCAVSALSDVAQLHIWYQLTWWIRELRPHVVRLSNNSRFSELAIAAANRDQDGWRTALAQSIPLTNGASRESLLDAVLKMADKSSIDALNGIGGADVEVVRRQVVKSQAPRLFVRTLGSLAVHKGGWDTTPRTVTRTRLRSLLALLAANLEIGVSRDTVMDSLWPEADPAAAVNNLNQTVYKLRRFLDANYQEGRSPSYVLADADTVRLDPDLVRTDVSELRRFSKRLSSEQSLAGAAEAAKAILRLAKGEFLPELRYDDWVTSMQLAVTEEIRRTLLPIAEGKFASADPLLGAHAAAVLVSMDPFDEVANIALATQLSVTGRRVAARAAIERYVTMLRREFGDEPGPEAVVLAHRLGLQSIST